MLNKAIYFATKAHKGQVRKVTNSPFILHPLAVACLLNDAGEDEKTVIAGMLHDTVEDTDVTINEIKESFGVDIADLVAGCSENKALAWEERKQATITDLERATKKVCIITCADKVHNLHVSVAGIREEGEAFFTNFNRGYDQQKWYYMAIRNVLKERIPHHPLFKKYEKLCSEAFGDE